MQAEENNKRLRGKAFTSVLTAAASSSSSFSYSATSSIFKSESGHDTSYYIQCCNCRKLRILAFWVIMADLPSAWSCKLNVWDPSVATCDSAEVLTENVIEVDREKVL
jgi:hypothetical protein